MTSSSSAGTVSVAKLIGADIVHTNTASAAFATTDLNRVNGIILLTSLVFATFGRDTSLWIIGSVLFANGVGMGMWNVPNNSATMGSVPRSAYGVVSAFVNLVRNVGSVIGQAVVAAIVVGVMAADGFDIPLSEIKSTVGAGDAFIEGWRLAYIVVTVLSVMALITAILTRESDSSKPAG